MIFSYCQVLCMWYNITQQLHHKVNLLGQILIGKSTLISSKYGCIFSNSKSCTPFRVNLYVYMLTFHRRYYKIFSTLGLGARSSVAAFWPQLDPGSGHVGGLQRDEGVGSVNSDLTEVALMKTRHTLSLKLINIGLKYQDP